MLNAPIYIEMLQEEFEDTKAVIRIRKSKKIRQHNDQKNKQRSTKHTHKTKDRLTRTPLTTERGGGGTQVLRKCSNSCSTSGTGHVYLQLTTKLTIAFYIKSLIFYLFLYFE